MFKASGSIAQPQIFLTQGCNGNLFPEQLYARPILTGEHKGQLVGFVVEKELIENTNALIIFKQIDWRNFGQDLTGV